MRDFWKEAQHQEIANGLIALATVVLWMGFALMAIFVGPSCSNLSLVKYEENNGLLKQRLVKSKQKTTPLVKQWGSF